MEDFLSHSAKPFRRGESFSFSLNSGFKKFYTSECYVTTFDFLSKIFCLTLPKISVGLILQCFVNFGYQKNWIRGGV